MSKLPRLPPDTPGWKRLAQEMAREAHESNLPSRPRVRGFEGSEILVICNSYSDRDAATLRDREATALRVWLKGKHMEELAYAIYPREGLKGRPAYAMIIRMRGDRPADVVKALEEIVAQRPLT